jgi:Protein of unknown function (DUF3631)
MRNSASKDTIRKELRKIFDEAGDDPPNMNRAWRLLKARLPDARRSRVREVLKEDEFARRRRGPGRKRKSATLGHDEDARSAAVVPCGKQPDKDPGVLALTHTRTVFHARGIDRITSVALVEALLGTDDGFWSEWRGPRDARPPHKLTQAELAQLLNRFQIRPRTIWPVQRQPGDKSSRGYMRHQFDAAWRAYCPADTPTRKKSDT